MRFRSYLKEDIIQKALELPEPEVGEEYDKDYVSKIIEILNQAMEKAEQMEDGEAKDSIIADLKDKTEKWENLDKETKPEGPNLPPELLMAPEPAGGEEA